MKTARLPAALAAGLLAGIAPSASAAMTGVCASVRQVGGHTLVDLYATMQYQGNSLQAITLSSITTTAPGGFVQGPSPALKGWAPDAGFTSTPDSIDSFVTIGGSDLGDPAGPFYANNGLLTSSWPTGAWTGTPFSAPSNQFSSAVTVGWFVLVSNEQARAQDISGLQGRMDVFGSPSAGDLGVWFAHLVVAGDSPFSVSLGGWGARYAELPLWNAETYIDSADLAFTVPAPGALSLLAAAALRRARRS
jgi:hypothetical protein